MLPWNLGGLHHLKVLTLHSNRIAYLPNSLGLLELDEFTYNDNPIDGVLKSVYNCFL